MTSTTHGTRVGGGIAHAESPECTPASSTCSITPPMYTSPVWSRTASTSTSMASDRKRSISTGRSADSPPSRPSEPVFGPPDRSSPMISARPTPAGARRGRCASPGRRARSSAAPAPGSRRRPTTSSAWARSTAVPPGGCGMRSSSQSGFHFSRSSAASIDVGRRARHQLGGDLRRQLERRLPTERHDHLGRHTAGGRRLGGDHVVHVLGRQRLEVQAVRRVVVGRHGLGVAVDHHRLVAGVAQGEAGVDAAVVELDALADAVGTRAEDDHPRPVRRPHLVRVLPRRVVVRRARRRTRRRTCRRSCTSGSTPAAGRAAATPSPSTPHRWASWASEKPSRLARRQSARVIGAGPGPRRRRRSSTIASIWSRNQSSMRQRSWIVVDRSTPRRSSSPTWKMRSGVGTAIAASSRRRSRRRAPPRRGRRRARGGPARASAAPSAGYSGNVRPIAITSPTDCICVPSTPAVPGSFSNAQRGTFVTT